MELQGTGDRAIFNNDIQLFESRDGGHFVIYSE
jgi:hypothetical protein